MGMIPRMTPAERNEAIDKYDTLVELIDKKKIDYSKNAIEKDFKAFKFQTWMRGNIILTTAACLLIAPFTGGVSLGFFVVLIILSKKFKAGYENYLKLVNDLKSNSFNKSTFSGERSLNNDSYKLYLTKNYGVEKNIALERIVCNEKLFSTIDDALAYADSLEQALVNSST